MRIYRNKVTGYTLSVPDGTVFKSDAYEELTAPKEAPKKEAPKKEAPKKKPASKKK